MQRAAHWIFVVVRSRLLPLHESHPNMAASGGTQWINETGTFPVSLQWNPHSRQITRSLHLLFSSVEHKGFICVPLCVCVVFFCLFFLFVVAALCTHTAELKAAKAIFTDRRSVYPEMEFSRGSGNGGRGHAKRHARHFSFATRPLAQTKSFFWDSRHSNHLTLHDKLKIDLMSKVVNRN